MNYNNYAVHSYKYLKIKYIYLNIYPIHDWKLQELNWTLSQCPMVLLL